MLKIALIGGLSAICLGGAAFAQSGVPADPTMPMDPSAPMSTPQFITAASQSDEFEIQEGQMASSMGKSASVRKFGAEMVRDHTKTTANLHKAIMKAGMQVPPPPPLRADQQQMAAQLQTMSGAAFDKAYLQQQVQSHKEALMVQQNYSQDGDTPAIKAASAMTVPIVQQHLQMAQQLESSVGQ